MDGSCNDEITLSPACLCLVQRTGIFSNLQLQGQRRQYHHLNDIAASQSRTRPGPETACRRQHESENTGFRVQETLTTISRSSYMWVQLEVGVTPCMIS